MITYEIIKECLEILDLKYYQFDSGRIAVSYLDEDVFPYRVVTFITVIDDTMVSFSTQAIDYHPKGDLLAMANRHNCRTFWPSCYIDKDGIVTMFRFVHINADVSPAYILEDVVNLGIYQPVESFINFESTDEEFLARRNSGKFLS